MEIQSADQGSHANHKPGTMKDDGDMQRMGKVQEFKVSEYIRRHSIPSLTSPIRETCDLSQH